MERRSLASRLGALAVACLLIVGVALPAAAQSSSATVSGSIRDAQGGTVPKATVVLVSDRRGTTLTGALNASGDFVFPTVPPDVYTLRVSADGFKTAEQRAMTVNSNDRLSVGIVTLELGAVSEAVTVSAAAAELQTQSAERSYAVEGQVVQNIAVNGRGFFGLAFLAPGVVVNGQATPTGQESQAMSANGQRPSQNNVQIDGVTDVDTGNNGGPMVAVSLDSVQEFKVLTSNYQAEYGRSVGAQVIARDTCSSATTSTTPTPGSTATPRARTPPATSSPTRRCRSSTSATSATRSGGRSSSPASSTPTARSSSSS
jgi:hypothetical protein